MTLTWEQFKKIIDQEIAKNIQNALCSKTRDDIIYEKFAAKNLKIRMIDTAMYPESEDLSISIADGYITIC